MALGYCPALLRHINEIAEGNAPGEKMHVDGFLAMTFCCQNSTVSPINDGNQSNGHEKTLTVKYRNRPTSDAVSDDDTCDVNRIPAYNEWQLPNLLFKSTSWFLPDDTIRKYCDEASQMRSLGGGIPGIMNEHYGLFVEHANILAREINKSLVTAMATQFGDNITTGTSLGKVINIAREGDKFILDDGITEMQRDFQENEICGTPCIVGGGLWAAYDLQRQRSGLNGAGVNMGAQVLPAFYFDKDTQAIWGQNAIGVFAKGSVKFLGRNKYVGAFAGERPSGDFFATIPMPVEAFGCNADDCLKDLVFDLQMRYIGCPTEIEGPNGPQTVNRGWQFILSKSYGLWVQPDNAFAEGDELEGTNGTLKYFISNNPDSGNGAYAYTG